MLVWSHPDHFAMSVYPSMCVIQIFDACVNSSWLFCNVCVSSGSVSSFLMLVWIHPDHFAMSASSVCAWSFLVLVWSHPNYSAMSVHPQYVRDHSWCLCEVTLTILQCLCILRECVIILDACMQSPWLFHNVCGSSACVWSFLMLVWSHTDQFAMFVLPQKVRNLSSVWLSVWSYSSSSSLWCPNTFLKSTCLSCNFLSQDVSVHFECLHTTQWIFWLYVFRLYVIVLHAGMLITCCWVLTFSRMFVIILCNLDSLY